MSLSYERAVELLEYRDGDLYWKKRMSNHTSRDLRAGCGSTRGYRKVRVDKTLYFTHRVIWLLCTGAFPKEHIDHVNGSTADNRIENLREATNSQNLAANRRLSSKNISGFRGVTPLPGNKWRASIRVNYKTIHLGSFHSPQEAALAYKQASIAHFGEFSCHA